jgi:hypothetical protein
MEVLPIILGLLLVQLVTSWISLDANTFRFLLNWTSKPDDWTRLTVYVAVLGVGLLVVPASKFCFRYLVGSKPQRPIYHVVDTRNDHLGGIDGRVYGLEHSILNLEVPPKSMWMNMGYWEEKVIIFLCLSFVVNLVNTSLIEHGTVFTIQQSKEEVMVTNLWNRTPRTSLLPAVPS